MKKLLAGITVLSASAVPLAQAQVQVTAPGAVEPKVKVYGVADLAIAQYRTSGVSKTVMHPGGSGSRIGFLASEDLGGGLKVNARLEAGVNLDTGTSSSTNGSANRVFSRQAYVEIESRTFGSVRLGRLQGPTYNFFPTYDPMLLPAMDAWGVLTTLGNPAPGTPSGTGVSTGFNINPTQRTENTVGYISPRLAGFQSTIAYSLNEGVPTVPRRLEAGLDYQAGPLLVGALLVKVSGTPGAGAIKPADSVTEGAIGARFEAGPVQPYLTYIRRNVTDPTLGANGNVLNGNAESVALVGVAIPVSAKGTVRITAGRYKSGTPGRDARNAGIAYTYDVTRSLMLMAAYTRLTQGEKARWPVFQSPVPNAGAPVDGLIAGINVRF